MTECTACGHGPNKYSEGFTGPVIEINNPEQLILLRKVVIPASMGDETEVPPAIGKYRNVLLVYETNGHIYLYSSDGIPTKLANDISEDILDRIATLEEDVDTLEREMDNKQDQLTAGEGISITDESGDLVISATATSYTAGTGLNLNGTEFSVDTNTIATKQYVDGAPAFKPFPTSVVTNGTTQQLLDSVVALGAETGTAFLGTVNLSDMPAGLTQEEVEVYICSDYVVYAVMRSTDVAPYQWWCASYNYQGWQPVNTDTTYTAGSNVQISNQNVISATDTTYSAGTGLRLTGTTFSVDTTAVQEKLDTTQMAAVNSGINSTKVAQIETNATGISTINGKIPNAASTSNQLADKDFVNSSIATNTANFIGTFNSVAELEAYTGTVTNNDYAFVIVTDAQGNTAYDRYKYNGDTQQWLFEYELNNSSFTAAQWAAINSGITSGDVTKLSGLADIQTIGTNLLLTNGTLSATDTTYSNFAGATSSTAGAAGLVPAPASGETDKYLKSDGTWATVSQYSLPAATASTLGGVKIGTNLSMDANDVLSATDTTYTAGTGLGLTGSEFSVDFNDVQEKLTAGDNITIADESGDLVISATDTTYTAGTGISINNGVISATSSGPTVVQTTGTSTTDVMSQNAVTGTLFDGTGSSVTKHIAIGANSATQGGKTAYASVSIGGGARADGEFGIAIGGYGTNGAYATAAANGIAIGGYNPNASGDGSIAIGLYGATASGKGSIALGYASSATAQGQMNIGSTDTSYGYNNSNYRLLTGLYDPQNDHDAATKGYVDGKVLQNAGAPTTATVGTVGQLLEDTTNGKLYQCTGIDYTDPQNPVYTWVEVGGGSTITMTTTDPGEGSPLAEGHFIGVYSAS